MTNELFIKLIIAVICLVFGFYIGVAFTIYNENRESLKQAKNKKYPKP